jgi:hypothetical protein
MKRRLDVERGEGDFNVKRGGGYFNVKRSKGAIL